MSSSVLARLDQHSRAAAMAQWSCESGFGVGTGWFKAKEKMVGLISDSEIGHLFVVTDTEGKWRGVGWFD